MNESYFLLAALRRKAGSPKEPDLCESDCEVIAPGGGPWHHQVADSCIRLVRGAGLGFQWFQMKVLREQTGSEQQNTEFAVERYKLDSLFCC